MKSPLALKDSLTHLPAYNCYKIHTGVCTHSRTHRNTTRLVSGISLLASGLTQLSPWGRLPRANPRVTDEFIS